MASHKTNRVHVPAFCSAHMTTGGEWFSKERDHGLVWLPKEITETTHHPMFNSHNNKRSMISNSTETLPQLLFNFNKHSLQVLFNSHFKRRSKVFSITKRSNKPRFDQLIGLCGEWFGNSSGAEI